VRREVADAADRLLRVRAGQPWGQPYAPGDGRDWDSNGQLLANLVVLAVAHAVDRRLPGPRRLTHRPPRARR